jgi:hypothetical protein
LPITPAGSSAVGQTSTPIIQFTNACATASGATLTNTNFSNAFLYGADFGGTGTTLNGTVFASAVLTAANFALANFQVNAGAAPDFNKALLQGAVFGPTATLVGANMFNAFVDFGPPARTSLGNDFFLLLGAEYTGFRNWSGARTLCVQLSYGGPSVVPPFVSMTCPNGSTAACGNGRSEESQRLWKSSLLTPGSTVPGAYQFNTTYNTGLGPEAPGACTNGATPDSTW